MNVTTDDIRNIKPGRVEAFVCEDERKMQSAASMLSAEKRYDEMPDGVVDYEYRKDKKDGVCIMLIHALREGEQKILNL